MPYNLHEESSSCIVFRQNKFYNRFAVAFTILALIFLGAGICGVLFYKGDVPVARPFFIVFAAVAAVLLCLGWIVPRLRKRFDPYEIIFDNEKGRTRIVQDKAGNQEAFIPYNEIARFDIRIKKESRNGSTSTSRPYYRYFVHFLKKDGGIWDLHETGNETQAIQMLEHLKQIVRLDATPVPAGKTGLSSKITADNLAGLSSLRWKNPTLGGFLLFIPVVCMIGGVFFFFWNVIPDDTFFKIVLGFMSFIFLLVISFNGYKLLKDAFRSYGIRIDSSTLEYFEETKSGEVKKTVSYALPEIERIVYHFMERAFESDIYILRKEEAEMHSKLANGDIGFNDLGKLFGTSMNELRLRLTQLNCTERLQVENWLQEEIVKRTGKEKKEL
ncbi:MAG: hypothetical protein FD123_668 [Bacteroidetes bacterium]|nr:MAG: hypothetical protein FD123_668 [Bacteroidota bacterium]